MSGVFKVILHFSIEELKVTSKELIKRPDVHIIFLMNFLNVIHRMCIVSTFKVSDNVSA